MVSIDLLLPVVLKTKIDNYNLSRKRKKRNNNIIKIIPIYLKDDIKPHSKIDMLILESLEKKHQDLFDNDILVIAHKVVSKAEDRLVSLEYIKPSAKSLSIAKKNDKDPRIVEIILEESKDIVRLSKGVIIVETKHGFICANAGVDQSNIEDSINHAVLLPIDPDRSARKIRDSLVKKTGKDIAVVITDTFGRPFREGQTNVAIGIAGIEPIKSYIGSADMYGRKLKVTEIAVVDEIASAAELAMGKLERIPFVILRGYNYRKAHQKSAQVSKLIRPKEKDLFR